MALGRADRVQKEDRVAPLEGRSDRSGIEQIARDGLGARRERLFRVAGEDRDVRALPEKLPDDLGSDGAGASEDEDVHAASLLSPCGR